MWLRLSKVKQQTLVDCIFNRTYCLPWGLGCIVYTVSTGIGTWGLNKTVGWAWDITNLFGGCIGHAGTLISAVLLLFRQRWRILTVLLKQ
jgi:hypothetical protein